jgi:hypothetical protein
MLLSNLLETIFHCHYKKLYLNYDLNKNNNNVEIQFSAHDLSLE